MAAHILTAINQIIENPEREFRHIKAALNLSCWTEDLDLNDYSRLSLVENSGELRFWAQQAKGKYEWRWEKLECPETREEWHKAQYGGQL